MTDLPVNQILQGDCLKAPFPRITNRATKGPYGNESLDSPERRNMPGPVSDRYHPEWGTGDNANQIREAIQTVYDKVSTVLGGKKPLYILSLVQREDLSWTIPAEFTEQEWRILRFCCERAMESI